MKYYFYRTTNLINGKYYQGVHHSTCPEKDMYCGSGAGIIAAVKKYGRENFKVEILKYFNTLEEAYNYEAKTITLDSLDARVCYNQVPGGKGCRLDTIYMYQNDEEIRVHKKLQPYYESIGFVRGRSTNARKHISEVRKGKESSQKGRVYLHLGTDTEIRVKPEEVSSKLEEGYVLGHSELSKQRSKRGHVGTVWMTDGTTRISVQKNDIKSYEKKGFKLGVPPFSASHRKNISRAKTGKRDSEETRQKKRESKLGKTWTVVEGKRVWQTIEN